VVLSDGLLGFRGSLSLAHQDLCSEGPEVVTLDVYGFAAGLELQKQTVRSRRLVEVAFVDEPMHRLQENVVVTSTASFFWSLLLFSLLGVFITLGLFVDLAVGLDVETARSWVPIEPAMGKLGYEPSRVLVGVGEAGYCELTDEAWGVAERVDNRRNRQGRRKRLRGIFVSCRWLLALAGTVKS
jgi:hypothetical protein